MRSLLVGLLSGMIMAGQAGRAPAQAPSDERGSVIAAGNALSAAIAAQGVAAGLGGGFAEDVILLSPRANLVRGRAAAGRFLSSDPLRPHALEWSVIAADVSNDGSQGFTWSQGSSTFDLGTGRQPRPCVFLIYWRRAARGDWKVAAMTINAGGPHTGGFPAGFGTPDSKGRRSVLSTEPAKHRAEVLSADAAFSAASVAHGSGPAFRQFAAPNAVAVSGPGFVFGPEAIGAAFAGEAGDTVSWVPRFSDAAASGDLAFTVGEAIFDLSSGPFYSKYLTVWRKQDSGEWKWVADFGNSRPAPAP